MQVADVTLHNRGHRLDSLLPDVALPASVAATPISAIVADSRTAKPGGLFFAVSGTAHNGEQFIDAAVKGGAVAVVVEDPHFASDVSITWRGDVPVIGVGDALTAMGRAAACFYGDPSRSLTVTGVTGTNGKSTCVSLFAQLQQLLDTKAAMIGTLGYGLVGEKLQITGMTTPDAISCQRILREMVDRQVHAVAMEVSSHALVQKRTAGIHLSTGIFTNISRDHLDYHSNMARYVEAKAQLFRHPGLRHAVVNLDDQHGAEAMMAAVQPGARLWTYGLRDPAADVYASRLRYLAGGTDALVRTPWGSGYLRSNLLGEFNVYNLLAVVTAACAQGADFSTVLELVPYLQPVKGRMQRVMADAPIQVVVDYAHTPDALRQALMALRGHGQQNVHVVFGCGGDRDSGKRPLMAAVAETCADSVVVTSDNPRTEPADKIIDDICRGFTDASKVTVITDRAAAIAHVIDRAVDGDVILIAGKGHEDYQIVGLNRLPFDDAAHARRALVARTSRGGQ